MAKNWLPFFTCTSGVQAEKKRLQTIPAKRGNHLAFNHLIIYHLPFVPLPFWRGLGRGCFHLRFNDLLFTIYVLFSNLDIYAPLPRRLKALPQRGSGEGAFFIYNVMRPFFIVWVREEQQEQCPTPSVSARRGRFGLRTRDVLSAEAFSPIGL